MLISLSGFVNEQAELAQTRMEQTLRSQHNKHFMNLEEIAGNLLEHEDCATDNTLPVTLEAIANFEKHPSPSDVNGVDLKVLYQMLANMTAGYPVDDIEHGPTKDFLKQCYTVRNMRLIFSLMKPSLKFHSPIGSDGQCFGDGRQSIEKFAK